MSKGDERRPQETVEADEAHKMGEVPGVDVNALKKALSGDVAVREVGGVPKLVDAKTGKVIGDPEKSAKDFHDTMKALTYNPNDLEVSGSKSISQDGVVTSPEYSVDDVKPPQPKPIPDFQRPWRERTEEKLKDRLDELEIPEVLRELGYRSLDDALNSDDERHFFKSRKIDLQFMAAAARAARVEQRPLTVRDCAMSYLLYFPLGTDNQEIFSRWRKKMEERFADQLNDLEIPKYLEDMGYNSLDDDLEPADAYEFRHSTNREIIYLTTAAQQAHEEQRSVTVRDCAMAKLLFNPIRRTPQPRAALYDPKNDPQGAIEADAYMARQQMRANQGPATHDEIMSPDASISEEAQKLAWGGVPAPWIATHTESGAQALIFASGLKAARRHLRLKMDDTFGRGKVRMDEVGLRQAKPDELITVHLRDNTDHDDLGGITLPASQWARLRAAFTAMVIMASTPKEATSPVVEYVDPDTIHGEPSRNKLVSVQRRKDVVLPMNGLVNESHFGKPSNMMRHWPTDIVKPGLIGPIDFGEYDEFRINGSLKGYLVPKGTWEFASPAEKDEGGEHDEETGAGSDAVGDEQNGGWETGEGA